jgi:tetratricopeptide (TPR) repeat protein
MEKFPISVGKSGMPATPLATHALVVYPAAVDLYQNAAHNFKKLKPYSPCTRPETGFRLSPSTGKNVNLIIALSRIGGRMVAPSRLLRHISGPPIVSVNCRASQVRSTLTAACSRKSSAMNEFGRCKTRQQIIATALLAASSFVMSCGLVQALPGNCAQLHDTKLAISSCTEHLNSHPENQDDEAAAYFYRGTALGASERYDEAIEDLSKAIEIAPAWPMPYSNRARAFMSKGEPARALADYSALVELSPRNAVVYVDRAFAYMKLKDFDHALADLQQGLELKPNDSFVIYNIGRVYESKGNVAQAEAEYRKALALSPENRTVTAALKRIGATP